MSSSRRSPVLAAPWIRVASGLAALAVIGGGALFIDETPPVSPLVPWAGLVLVTAVSGLTIRERAAPEQVSFQVGLVVASLVGGLVVVGSTSESGEYPWSGPLLVAALPLLFVCLAPSRIRPGDLTSQPSSPDLPLIPRGRDWIGYAVFAVPFVVLAVLIWFPS